MACFIQYGGGLGIRATARITGVAILGCAFGKWPVLDWRVAGSGQYRVEDRPQGPALQRYCKIDNN
jgi:hypothetical protein